MRFVNNNKKLKLLVIIFLLGFITGMFLIISKEVKVDIINSLGNSKVKIFINTFTINIWAMLIVWILNNSFLNMIITFLKGLTEAIYLISFLSYLNELKIINFVSYTIYWLLMIPLFLWIIYKLSYDSKKEKNTKTVLISFLITAIYSFLIAIIN